jgi:hypothetical protein
MTHLIGRSIFFLAVRVPRDALAARKTSMPTHANTRLWRLRASALLNSSKGRCVRAGESRMAVARALGVSVRTMDGWRMWSFLPAPGRGRAGRKRGFLARYRCGGFGALRAKPLYARPPEFYARAKMDLRHSDAEEPVAAQIPVRVADARDGGGADQADVQHRAGRQSGWPIVGAVRHRLREPLASRIGAR